MITHKMFSKQEQKPFLQRMQRHKACADELQKKKL